MICSNCDGKGALLTWEHPAPVVRGEATLFVENKDHNPVKIGGGLCGLCDGTGWIPTGWLAEFLDPKSLQEMVGS